MSVPEFNFSTGGRFRLLGEDQKLILKAVLEIVGGSSEKGHVILTTAGDPLRCLCCQFGNDFLLCRQSSSLLSFRLILLFAPFLDFAIRTLLHR